MAWKKSEKAWRSSPFPINSSGVIEEQAEQPLSNSFMWLFDWTCSCSNCQWCTTTCSQCMATSSTTIRASTSIGWASHRSTIPQPRFWHHCYKKTHYTQFWKVSMCLFMMLFTFVTSLQLPATSFTSKHQLSHRALAAAEIGKAWLKWWLSAVLASIPWHCPLNPPLHPSTAAEPSCFYFAF